MRSRTSRCQREARYSVNRLSRLPLTLLSPSVVLEMMGKMAMMVAHTIGRAQGGERTPCGFT